MQEQVAHFDAWHKRAKGFKILGLWVYHPAMHHLLRLATMDVRTEATAEIKYFLSTHNDILTELGDDGQPHLTNPEKIMVDDAGANMAGIVEEFVEEFYHEKIVTCQ